MFINQPLWYGFGKRLTAGWGGPLKAGDGARTPKEIQARCAPVGGVAAPGGAMKYTRADGLEFIRKVHEGPVWKLGDAGAHADATEVNFMSPGARQLAQDGTFHALHLLIWPPRPQINFAACERASALCES